MHATMDKKYFILLAGNLACAFTVIVGVHTKNTPNNIVVSCYLKKLVQVERTAAEQEFGNQRKQEVVTHELPNSEV